ncbi:hypothetical protein IGI39_001950 [Enterococcus sp. AZ135]|uniref:hypothetical protein n=1 Tax=unclassified Enterococcus TaxID=2608891 RepID=UPI003F23D916
MKKIHWLHRLALLTVMFGAGALATGFLPLWIKIILIAIVGGYQLLMTEFEYEVKRNVEEGKVDEII